MSQSKMMMGIGMPISQRSMPRTESFLSFAPPIETNNVRPSCEVPLAPNRQERLALAQ